LRARGAQHERAQGLNSVLALDALEQVAAPDAPGAALLAKAAETLALSARAYHRTLKVARTIADLAAASISPKRSASSGNGRGRSKAASPTSAKPAQSLNFLNPRSA
jgi:magnesium chelatase family protein